MILPRPSFMISVIFLLIYSTSPSFIDDGFSPILGVEPLHTSHRMNPSSSYTTEQHSNLMDEYIQDLKSPPKILETKEKLMGMCSLGGASLQRSLACGLLGDIYSGLLVDIEYGYFPVDLKKAFEFYRISTTFPFPDIAKAYYMIGFIAYYHPNFASEDFLPNYITPDSRNKILTHSSDSSFPEDSTTTTIDSSLSQNMDQFGENSHFPENLKIYSTEEEESEEKLDEDSIKPNIPLSLLHSTFAAKGNYSSALMSLGYKIFYGHHTPPSCHKALEFYRQAAYQVLLPDHYKPRIKLETHNIVLEEEFFSGRNYLLEEADMMKYLHYSAESGIVESQIKMGIIFLEGDIGGITRDYKKAVEYFQKAANSGSRRGMSHLAYCYQKGYGVQVDMVKAKNWYDKAARMDFPVAQTQLGKFYYYGWGGLNQDFAEAKKWFEKAAEHNAEALVYLGRMTFSGLGLVKKSHVNAKNYYSEAAQSENLEALYNLGIMNANGFGVKVSCEIAAVLYRKVLKLTLLKSSTLQAYKLYTAQEYERALIHYELSADQGDDLAQINTAWLYERGIKEKVNLSDSDSLMGILKESKRKALEFYIRAAEQGSALAHLKVGDYYYFSEKESNPERAVAYYQVASDSRNAQATFNLGWMHHYGIGIPKDFHLAKRYYDKSTEENSDGYIAGQLALFKLYLDQSLYSLYQIPDQEFSIYGIDNLLIGFLLLCLITAIILRQAIAP